MVITCFTSNLRWGLKPIHGFRDYNMNEIMKPTIIAAMVFLGSHHPKNAKLLLL